MGEGNSIISHDFAENSMKTKKHSSRMCTDREVTRMSSGQVAMRRTVDRQTPVTTLPSLAVDNERNWTGGGLESPALQLVRIDFRCSIRKGKQLHWRL